MNIIKKIVRDLRNGNIIDIQFVPFYKKQQEIEWPFKLRKLYLVRCVIHYDMIY